MKEEIKRIMKLVQEGKLSPEDAAELIEAFEKAPVEEVEDEHEDSAESTSDSTGEKKSDPFAGLVDAIDKLGKRVAQSVDWEDVANQVKESAKKGVEAVRVAAEQAKHGKNPFNFFGSSELKEVSLPLDIPKGKTLRVENPAGDIRIYGNSEGSVLAKATLRGHDAEEAKQKAEQYTLVIEESDHFVLIKQPDVTGLSVDLEIKMSGKAPIEIKCQSGDIEIDSCTGGVRINGASGDVRLHEVKGTVDISTMSGDVTIKSAESSSVNIEGKSGDVSLEEVEGNVNIRTASGDVSLKQTTGKTTSIEAVSGDVTVEASEAVDGTINVRTVNGNIRVGVPSNSNCRVALSALRGTVTSEFELADEAKAESRLTGKLGDGLGSIDLSAVNGDVALGEA